MDQKIQLAELNDEELGQVAGGTGYGTLIQFAGGDILNQRNINLTSQQANVHGGIAAVGFNINVTTPMNIITKIGG